MATLTLIGEPFADGEAAAHAEAARELTLAVAIAAPRGCSSRLLVSIDREAPAFETARARTERLPLKAAALPLLWRTGVTARPLDGEFVHSLTPLVPLRGRSEDDGSQTSVMVPHALGWLAPQLMGSAHARQYRAFVKRAVRLADVLVTPTHATAVALQERYGNATVQVLPIAPPSSYLRPDDAEDRRSALALPPRYIATSAAPGEIGRLGWALDALAADAELPPLVVIAQPVPDAAVAGASDAAPDPGMSAAIPEALRDRVHLVRPRELADVGAILSGAELLAVPQEHIGAGYEILGALASGVPVVHSDCAATAELTLDAGVSAGTAEEFAAALSRVTRDAGERQRLAVLAEDRSRSFSWAGTAALLWELHANI